ncbi:MAG TPA: DNA repair protein RecO [Anaerolineae bacterium]|nr:DNA repair protein RecO [Anaerolineae bacterium]
MSGRERVYRTEAIVLRRTDFGEADRLLTVFTPQRGKLRLVAKGARKPTSRKSGHVELFSHGQFLVAVGRELDILTQAETLEPYLALREDLLRTTYAYYVAELADAFAAEQDENRPLFDLLKDAFGWLCTAEDLALVARYYELHLLGLVGYQPQLFICGMCKVQLKPEINYLSPADGSVVCRQCGYDRMGTIEISVNALKVLRFLQTRQWETCRLLRLSSASHAQVERAMNQYITYHLERKLKSVEFIHRLRRQMGVG